MPRRRINVPLLITAISLFIGVFCAPQSRASADEQVWVGTVALDQGLQLEVLLTLAPGPDGSMIGSVDIPMQGFEGVKVSDLEFDENSISFRLPFPGMQEDLIPLFELMLNEDRASATGTLTQGPRVFDATFKKTTTEEIEQQQNAKRPQTPRPPFPYRNFEVSVPVTEDGAVSHVLAGTLTLPDAEEFGDGPYACAVFLTGSGPQDRDETIFEHKPFAVLADALARAGVASIRCDERGIGESTGDFVLADSHDFAADAVAQVQFVGSRADIDADRVGLIGHSEGGLTGSIAAAEHPEEISFLVTIAGMGLTGRETLLGQSAKMLEVSGAPADFIETNKRLQAELYDLIQTGAADEEVYKSMMGMVLHQLQDQAERLSEMELDRIVRQQLTTFGTPWMQVLLAIDPAEYFSKIQQPVLVMNGDLDVQVLPDENIGAITAALEQAGNERVTVKRFEGLNHLMQNAQTGAMAEYDALTETFDPNAMKVLVDWVVETSTK